MAARQNSPATLPPRLFTEDVRIWRSPVLPGLELTVARHCTRRWRVLHERYAVCVVPVSSTTNVATYRYRARDLLIHNGMIGVLEPGETHVNTCDPLGGNFWVAHLDPGILQEAARDLAGHTGVPHFRANSIDSPHLLTVFSRMYKGLQTGVSVLEQQSRLAACIRVLLDCCAERSPASTKLPVNGVSLNRVREYLHAHYQESVSLEELAMVGGISRFHLARAFRATYGVPPHTYHNQLRVAAVARDLRAAIPMSRIEAGFYDQSHLIKHFKRAVGVTPQRYASPSASALPRFP